MRLSILILAAVAVALGPFVGCSNRTVMTPVVIPSPECVISQGLVETANTITVALLDDISPGNAPVARNDSERILFRHVYETLITVDCLGRVQAGLAKGWRRGGDGRIWTFELREDVQFWDGTPLTAEDVIRSWRRFMVETMVTAAGIDSTGIVKEHVLRVYFDRPHREVPRVLSSLEFAVVKRAGESLWPVGSGSYRIETPVQKDAAEFNRTVVCTPVSYREGPVIRFVETRMSDTRDLLEGVIDVMVTADPAVIEYALRRPQLTTVALPWNRTYVLLSPSRVLKLLQGGTVGDLPPDLLDGFAQDAVRGDARGHRSPSWWETLDECGRFYPPAEGNPPMPYGAHAGSGLRRILYAMKDPIARDLAERIVALAATDTISSSEAAELAHAVPGLIGNDFRIVTEGKPEKELEMSIRDGDEFAYIIPVSCQWTDPCYEERRLTNSAPWLSIEVVDLSDALIPLVDTRRYVIVDRSSVEPVIDYSGDILITNGVSQER